MERNRKEPVAKRPVSRTASSAVRSSRTSTSSQSEMTSPRTRKTVAGSAEIGMTSPRAGTTPHRRRSLSRRHSQSRRRKRIKRKRPPSAVVILQRKKDRLESDATKNSVSLVRVTSKNVVYFLLLYSAVLCIRAAVTTYLEGVLDELRKKYALSHSQIALIQGTQLIGILVSLIFVALSGRNWHKPLLLTVGVLVASLGTMVYAVPYFVEKTSGSVRTSCAGYGASTEGLPLTSYAQVCQYGQWNSSYVSPCSPCLTNPRFLDRRQTTLSILSVAGFLVGLGTGAFVTTGYVYLEESGGRKNGPIFYGVLLSMTGFGHFLGSCVTWWFLGYTEDLHDGEEVELSWAAKAWWLGFVVFSILLFFCSSFFLFFPKWIAEPDWATNARRRHLRHLEKRIEQEKALRKLKRERRKQRHRRRTLLGSVALSCASESLSDDGLPDHVTSVSDAISSTSGPVECVTPTTESTSVFTGNTDDATEDASSSCSSDSEIGTNGTEVTVASPIRTSGGTGSGLGIIAEEESGISRLPSSPLPVEVGSVDRSRLGDDATPVWPLHLSEEASRQSRVVTFASGVADATGNQSGGLAGYSGTRRKQPKERTPRRQASKNLGKTFTALKRTILSPVFTLSLIGTALSAYLSAGYRSNVVQFVEVQYGQAPVYAWFYTAGLCYSIAETVGPLIGGIIVHKLRLSLFKQIQMIICLLVINIILFVLIFPINLPNGGFQWWQNGNSSSNSMPSVPSLASTCLSKCDCLDVQFDPVCSQDGRTKYFSACHAGCTQLYLQNASIIYSNCSCVAGALASSSFCSSDFPIYGAFWVVLFFAITAHSMGQVSVILIFLRSVQEIDRNLALSVAIWVIIVAAFVPGPPVFEALEGTSCTTSRSNCFGEETCWLYDLDHYRYVIHGASMAFQLVAICFFFGAFYHLRSDPIEPVGYGKEEIRSVIGANQVVLEAKGPEAGNEVARQTMMEMVQSRIALTLLANHQDLMKFSQPERNGSEPERKLNEPELANDPTPSTCSGSSDLKAELEARGKEEARRRVSSSDSSVFVKAKVADSNSAEDAEVTSRQTIFSDQSDDSVFARNNPDNTGYENETYDARPEDEVETGEDKIDGSSRESQRIGMKVGDTEDTSSTVADSTRL